MPILSDVSVDDPVNIGGDKIDLPTVALGLSKVACEMTLETEVRDNAVAGVIFESKEGRKAIRAAVTIDCTGDGDIFHRAGAASYSDIDTRDIHHCINTAWLFGGVDMRRWIDFKTTQPAAFAAFMERGRAACGGLFERPFVSWRNDVALFMGPRLAGYSAVDVEDLTEVEIRSRRLMAQHLMVYRDHAPGFAAASPRIWAIGMSCPRTGGLKPIWASKACCAVLRCMTPTPIPTRSTSSCWPKT